MTNEELTAEIKAGRTGYGELWEQVQAFVRQQAARYMYQNAGLCAGAGVEFEDLLQAGFLALHNAVKGFEPEAGMSFVGYLAFHLKRYFRACCGIRTSKRDPLDQAARLDAPVSDEDGAATLGELTPDAQAEAEWEAIEDEVFQEQLRGAMTKVLDTLDARQQDIIRRRFWYRETLAGIAGHTGITLERVRQIEGQAMRAQRRALGRYPGRLHPPWRMKRERTVNEQRANKEERAILCRYHESSRKPLSYSMRRRLSPAYTPTTAR